MEWPRYLDTEYHFCINYPPEYALVERIPPSERTPKPVHMVALLSRQLAQSPTAEFQPPNALVEIFPNTAGKSLADWVGHYEPRATHTRLRVGALEGYRITLPILLAPNEFFYFSSGTYIYRLTFLGEHAEQMLQSFRIEG